MSRVCILAAALGFAGCSRPALPPSAPPAAEPAPAPEPPPPAEGATTPQEVTAAYQRYFDARSLHAVLERREAGAADRVEVWVERGTAALYRDPYRTFEDRGGKFVDYYPSRNVARTIAVDGDARMQLQWLPPLAAVHHAGPSDGFGQPEGCRAGAFAGVPAWVAEPVPIPDGRMALFFRRGDAAFLGWRETYAGGYVREFEVKAWEWDAPGPVPPAGVPADAAAAGEDVGLYLEPGRPLPRGGYTDAAGRAVDVGGLLRGKRGAVVTIGTAGCGPCVRMQEWMRRRSADMERGQVAAVAVEVMTPEAFAAAAARHAPPPSLLRFDPGANPGRVLRVGGYPTNYCLDAGGRVVSGWQGFDPARAVAALAGLGVSVEP